jgi:threonine/homoserine/homoserine lactone efflux protein
MAAFVISAFVLAMLPGPATALLIRKPRVATGGSEVGIFTWAVLSGLGVAALVAASALAYAILRAVVWHSKGQKGHIDGSVTCHELAPSLTL